MIAAACLVILLVAVSSNTQAQFLGYPAVPYYAQYPGGYYGFNPVAPSIDLNSLGPFGTRLLFSNGPLVNAVRQTLTLVTTTSVTTVTVSTTCTTSTTTLSSCTVPSRRRRTSLLANGSLFADAQEETEDESIFLPKKPEEKPFELEPTESDETKRDIRSTHYLPFVLQPGFQAPEQIQDGRLLIAIGTSTVTKTSTATSTVQLTAICQSTTDFSTCSS